jgi:hypothetical protein
MVTLLGYLSTGTAAWVASHSRVPLVLARRSASVAGTVFTSF